MKHFSKYYLCEALSTEAKQWLKSVIDTQKALADENNFNPIEIDINKLNKPRNPFTYEDFFNDAIVKNILNDKKVGFVITNQMVRNSKNFIFDDTKNIKPNCFPYWYQDAKNIFFVGICIYDKENTYIDGFANLIDIESSLMIKNSEDLNKAIFNDFIKIMSTDNKIKGIVAKPKHAKIKALFIKLGFSPSKENNELLTYKI